MPVREQHPETVNLDWLYVGLPLGCLASINERIGAYPLADTAQCQLWLEPLFERLAEVSAAALLRAQGQLVTIGFEVAGMVTEQELRGELPTARHNAYVLRTGTTATYVKPTEWA